MSILSLKKPNKLFPLMYPTTSKIFPIVGCVFDINFPCFSRHAAPPQLRPPSFWNSKKEAWPRRICISLLIFKSAFFFFSFFFFMILPDSNIALIDRLLLWLYIIITIKLVSPGRNEELGLTRPAWTGRRPPWPIQLWS